MVKNMNENIKSANPLGTQKESKLLVKFAIPCIISMLVTALYNIVDQIFIGQGIGINGNAATNITFPLSTTCTAISLLLGIGSATNVSLKLRAKEDEEASNGMSGHGESHPDAYTMHHRHSGSFLPDIQILCQRPVLSDIQSLFLIQLIVS